MGLGRRGGGESYSCLPVDAEKVGRSRTVSLLACHPCLSRRCTVSRRYILIIFELIHRTLAAMLGSFLALGVLYDSSCVPPSSTTHRCTVCFCRTRDVVVDAPASVHFEGDTVQSRARLAGARRVHTPGIVIVALRMSCCGCSRTYSSRC